MLVKLISILLINSKYPEYCPEKILQLVVGSSKYTVMCDETL